MISYKVIENFDPLSGSLVKEIFPFIISISFLLILSPKPVLPHIVYFFVHFVTAKSADEDILNGFYTGGVDYLTKPYRAVELKQRVKTHLKLKDLMDNLETKVKEETEKRVHQEKILIQQNKLAMMGEMIDAIAHQWKQPLGLLSMRVNLLDVDFHDGFVDEPYMQEYVTSSQNQIKHALNTLEEFRSFFRPNTKKEEFSFASMIEETLILVKDELMNAKIQISHELDEKIAILGNKNEFKHIILNIINNAKDAFIEKDLEDRQIFIKLYKDEDDKKLEISDNAGGIPTDVIEHIFKINFTTKEEGKGTGIGLYMSEQIAQKNGAEISVKNLENGAQFTLVVK